MLEILLEFLLEVLVQLIIEIGCVLGFESLKKMFHRIEESNPVISFIGFILLGGLLGLAFTWFFPVRMFPKRGISGISIIISPVGAGFIMQWWGNWRRKRGKSVSFLATFWGGATFALAFALTRWLVFRNL